GWLPSVDVDGTVCGDQLLQPRNGASAGHRDDSAVDRRWTHHACIELERQPMELARGNESRALDFGNQRLCSLCGIDLVQPDVQLLAQRIDRDDVPAAADIRAT